MRHGGLKIQPALERGQIVFSLDTEVSCTGAKVWASAARRRQGSRRTTDTVLRDSGSREQVAKPAPWRLLLRLLRNPAFRRARARARPGAPNPPGRYPAIGQRRRSSEVSLVASAGTSVAFGALVAFHPPPLSV